MLQQFGLVDKFMLVDQCSGESFQKFSEKVYELLYYLFVFAHESFLNRWVNGFNDDSAELLGDLCHNLLATHGVDISGLLLAMEYFLGEGLDDRVQVGLLESTGYLSETLHRFSLNLSLLVIELLQESIDDSLLVRLIDLLILEDEATKI